MDTSGDIKPSTKWNHISLVPHLESATNCDFSVTQHVLLTTSKLRLGRYIDSFNFPDRISFKSSAVSREHAEIYVSGGKYYIRDMKSTAGTFLNDQRLGLPCQFSEPHILKEGDIIQLGKDIQYRGKEMCRCVKIKVYMTPSFEERKPIGTKSIKLKNSSPKTLDECCICLSDMELDQELFSTPCSHSFHLECCLPLFKQSSIFRCPLCRSHVILRANEPLKFQRIGHGLQYQPF